MKNVPAKDNPSEEMSDFPFVKKSTARTRALTGNGILNVSRVVIMPSSDGFNFRINGGDAFAWNHAGNTEVIDIDFGDEVVEFTYQVPGGSTARIITQTP